MVSCELDKALISHHYQQRRALRYDQRIVALVLVRLAFVIFGYPHLDPQLAGIATFLCGHIGRKSAKGCAA